MPELRRSAKFLVSGVFLVDEAGAIVGFEADKEELIRTTVYNDGDNWWKDIAPKKEKIDAT
jgi:hypothetical protein